MEPSNARTTPKTSAGRPWPNIGKEELVEPGPRAWAEATGSPALVVFDGAVALDDTGLLVKVVSASGEKRGRPDRARREEPGRHRAGATGWSPPTVGSVGARRRRGTPMTSVGGGTFVRTAGRRQRSSGVSSRRTHLVSPSGASARLPPLPFGEGDLARADLRRSARSRSCRLLGVRVGLGPEVARVGRVATELELDQVVLLVVGRAAAHAVLAHLPDLQLVRVLGRRPDRARPAVPQIVARSSPA